MRALVQRVSRARVLVRAGDGSSEVTGEIGNGLLVFIGALQGDTAEDAAFIERKLVSLRIFPDDAGRMNRSVTDVGGALLLVSQFTLAADIGKGARPSFVAAMAPGDARSMIEGMVERLRALLPVQTGRFGAHMEVELTNDGPVTLWLDSRKRERS